jgi:hypothetical protein
MISTGERETCAVAKCPLPLALKALPLRRGCGLFGEVAATKGAAHGMPLRCGCAERNIGMHRFVRYSAPFAVLAAFGCGNPEPVSDEDVAPAASAAAGRPSADASGAKGSTSASTPVLSGAGAPARATGAAGAAAVTATPRAAGSAAVTATPRAAGSAAVTATPRAAGSAAVAATPSAAAGAGSAAVAATPRAGAGGQSAPATAAAGSGSSGQAGAAADDPFEDPFGDAGGSTPSTPPTTGSRDPNGPCKDLMLFCFDPFDMFTLNAECFTCNNGQGCMDCVDFQAI